jgi:hypothetical protein
MRSRQSRLASVTFAFVAASLCSYVLSYAPLYRYAFGADQRLNGDTLRDRRAWQDAFIPVEWLMDRRLLREPFLRWSEAWGVRRNMEREQLVRDYERLLRQAEAKHRP